jgi:hypothetical protein
MNTQTEEWRPVVGFEQDYEISSLGRVRSLKNKTNSKVGRILKTCLTHGYPYIILYQDNQRFPFSVHVLVARTFLGVVPDGKEVHHIDGSRNNNNLENLAYVSRAHNVSEGYRIGNNRSGEDHEWHKLTVNQVREIRRAYQSGEGGYKNLAKRFNLPWGTIRNIVKGRRWKHIGTVSSESIREEREGAAPA